MIFRIVATSCLMDLALEAFTELTKALLVDLRTHKSEAGSLLEFLGLAASFRDDRGDEMACQALPETGIKKLVEIAEDFAEQDSAALATLQQLAGKLPFTRTSIMGRFGRAALQPVYVLIARGGGAFPRNVKDCLR